MTEKQKIQQNEYRKKPLGRALNLLSKYKYSDRKYKRGNGDLTAQWIVENIFTKPCAHCGETDWTKIGCNRIEDSKPHTKDNVEPCCKECNDKIHINNFKKKVDQIDKTTGEIIKSWDSTMDVKRSLGFLCSGISRCCMGKQKTHKGYDWKYPS